MENSCPTSSRGHRGFGGTTASACQGASLNGRSSKAKVGFVCGVNQEDLSPCLGLSPCSLMFPRFPQRSSVLGSSCAGVAGVALLAAPAGCPVWPRRRVQCGPSRVSGVAPAAWPAQLRLCCHVPVGAAVCAEGVSWCGCAGPWSSCGTMLGPAEGLSRDALCGWVVGWCGFLFALLWFVFSNLSASSASTARLLSVRNFPSGMAEHEGAAPTCTRLRSRGRCLAWASCLAPAHAEGACARGFLLRFTLWLAPC